MQRSRLWGLSLLAAGALAAACANGEPDDLDLDGDVGGDAGAPGKADGGSGGTLPGAGTDDAGGGGGPGGGGDDGGLPPDPGGCTGPVAINELMPDGANGAEFVELYNPGTCTISFAGWTLLYKAKGGNDGAGLYTFAPSDAIAPKGFFVIANTSFKGSKDAAMTGGAGMGNSGGQLGLANASGAIVDAVAYASGTTGAYTETDPAPMPGAGASIGRKSDGADSNDNSADFRTFATPSPGAPN